MTEMNGKYGKVLWWSKDRELGIIKDENGDKYYFDANVVVDGNVERGASVKFVHSIEFKDRLCADLVSLVK